MAFFICSHTSNEVLEDIENLDKKNVNLDTELSSHKNNTSNPHSVTKAQVGLGNVENKSSATIRGELTRSNVTTALGYTPLDSVLKGSVNGVAELDSNGKVPSYQLPSYVDDVIEGYLSGGKFYKDSSHSTEISGESGKIYIDLHTEKTYRWSGTTFSVISETLALGETAYTAYRGDRGKVAYDHSQATHARTDATNVAKSSTNGNIVINGSEVNVYTHPSGTNPHGTTKSDVGLGNVGNFKAVSTVASQGLSATEQANARANIGAGTSSFSGSYNDLSNKPTSLPASDVYAWAKASSKPSYSWSEITGKPSSFNPYFANKTWYLVGDDVYIGDHDVSGGLGILGANGTTRLDFCQYNNASNYKSITFDGTTLYMNGNCDYASSAGSVAWGNVSGRPTKLSQFTNDSGYITSSGSCAYASSAGSAPANGGTSSYTNIVNGTYTGNGGSQPPSYISGGNVKFNMMNCFKGLSNLPTYADCLLMDTYTGGDVPYVTGFGIIKASGNPRAFIAVGAKGNTSTWASQAELITTANIGSQSVNYASSAGNADTLDGNHASAFAAASHTHAYIPTSASCNKNWNWSGQSGQPSWLWGSNNGTDMYVYNPSNFSVNYANSAGYATSAGSAPASDVYAWAKASSKPSYSYSEVGAAAASHSHSSLSTGNYSVGFNSLNDFAPTSGTVYLGSNSNPWLKAYITTIYEDGTSLSEKYAAASHTHSYLPLSGGTVSGTFKATDFYSDTNGVHINSNSVTLGNSSGAGGILDVYNNYKRTRLRGNSSATDGSIVVLPAKGGTLALTSSDARLKDNITDSTVNALSVINTIKIRQFDWNDNIQNGMDRGTHQNIGFIADELEKIDKRFAFGGGEEKDGEMNIKCVDSFYMLGYVVKAIQELSKENELLKDKIKTLENK